MSIPKGGTNPIFVPNIPQKTYEIEKKWSAGGSLSWNHQRVRIQFKDIILTFEV